YICNNPFYTFVLKCTHQIFSTGLWIFIKIVLPFQTIRHCNNFQLKNIYQPFYTLFISPVKRWLTCPSPRSTYCSNTITWLSSFGFYYHIISSSVYVECFYVFL